jgi:hypothetical protein
VIRIKLYDYDIHRNECAFRPYLKSQDVLRDVGIEFTTGDSYDYAWIAQASFLNKKVSLEQSVNDGLEFLSKVSGDYMLLDGQDSTSLMGSYEVLKESNALLLMKNSLLKDRSLYKKGWCLGRYYWGTGDYALSDFDSHADKIVLSGTNWLSTHWSGINVQWYDISRPRQYDVSAMFQFPSTKVSTEHGQNQSQHYDRCRSPLLQYIEGLDLRIAKLDNGKRLSQQEYYQRMFSSKIVLAPFGYGEMAPRDLEAAMFGSVLIKPDMSYIDTAPNVFVPYETYIPCAHDFSDLADKINEVLGDTDLFYYIINNAREKFVDSMKPESLALHMYDLFSNLNGIEAE